MNRLRLASSTCRSWTLLLGVGLSGVGLFGAGTGCGSADEVEVYPGGQTGGEQPATGGNCDVEYRELALDEVAPFGATAASVLEPVLGTHSAPLSWSFNTGNVTIGPEQGTSEIELVVAYDGGRIAWARFVPTPVEQGPGTTGAAGSGAAGQAAPAALLGCAADRLEVELDVQLRTAGGALDERFVATLGASTPDNTQLTARLLLDALSGSFFVTTPSGASAPAIQISAVWDVLGFRGTINGEVEMRSPDPNGGGGSGGGGSGGGGSVGFGWVPFAEWPARGGGAGSSGP